MGHDPGQAMNWSALVACAWLACACGQVNGAADVYALPEADALADVHGATDAAAADQAVADVPAPDIASDVVQAADSAVGPDAGVDSGVQGSPPHWQPLAPVTLPQGATTALDLNPLLADAQDAVGQVQVSWSAQHVALQDPGSHVLYIVAPTTWTGTEAVVLTARDSLGLTATATLAVTVTEVKVAPPPALDACGKVTFSLAAGNGAHVVLLSGSFNGWASAAPAADLLTDPTGSGTWSVTRTLATGVYQYKFIVDGKWQADPGNPNQVPDGYGDKNSVVEVPTCKP